MSRRGEGLPAVSHLCGGGPLACLDHALLYSPYGFLLPCTVGLPEMGCTTEEVALGGQVVAARVKELRAALGSSIVLPMCNSQIHCCT